MQVTWITLVRIHTDSSDGLDGEPFIDCAITVVIFPVADLFLWQRLTLTFCPLRVLTGLGSGATVTDAFGPLRSAVWTFSYETFVDDTIAIVVETITNLCTWLFEWLASPPFPVSTDLFSWTTDARLVCVTAATLAFFTRWFFFEGLFDNRFFCDRLIPRLGIDELATVWRKLFARSDCEDVHTGTSSR
tara:strand:- start:2442 stop:3008 length:567 start_codon:yes stop_codon:yes gene_type:complete